MQLLAANESFGQCRRRVDACGTIVRDTWLAPSAGVPRHAHAAPYVCVVLDGAYSERVIKRIGDRLGSSDVATWKPDAVRAAAVAELAAHTALLQARGAARVASVLPD